MSVFRFKQFVVAQDCCAQKIGTDGVLLAAWTRPQHEVQSILDIGTGTGVIALMLAQRFQEAQVEAVELEVAAYEQATHNFENSPFADRLFCYHAGFQEFYEEVDARYNLIISNPPFFEQSNSRDNESMSAARHAARFDTTLPFEELVYGVYRLLDRSGTFAVIIPSDREHRFLEITTHFELLPVRKTYVRGTAASAVKRVLLEFRFRESVTNYTTTQLIIEESRHNYTPEYTDLVKDFYLKM